MRSVTPKAFLWHNGSMRFAMSDSLLIPVIFHYFNYSQFIDDIVGEFQLCYLFSRLASNERRVSSEVKMI